MKTKIFSLLLLLCNFCFAQTSEKPNQLSLGSGRQSYNGDLGNSWFKPKEEYYGFGILSYSRYLNRSFDVMLTVTHGDFGHCREEDESQFRPDGTEVLNMLSRLTVVNLTAKYKFANGYFLKETSKISPYVFAGAGFNNLTDFWWKNKTRVNQGNYSSVNGGLGIQYQFNKKLSLTYTLATGYFLSDAIDFRMEGNNDKYLQHALLVGFNF